MSSNYEKLQRHRSSLPVAKQKSNIVERIRHSPITLIVGETGSGKTTQIPQYLLENGFATPQNRIVCTQPRTVAATNVAKRVADECGCKLGSKVGYQVRLDSQESAHETELIYMTEGTLLRKAMNKSRPDLEGFSVVIVDEAHERTVNADLLMGFLKETVKRRCNKSKSDDDGLDFHVVIMSATLDIQRFDEYFEHPPLVKIPGNVKPITRFWLDKPTEDYLELTVKVVTQIHSKYPITAGDILVFLTGVAEIDTAVDMIKESAKKNNHKKLSVIPLYSQMSSDLQNKAFQSADHNTRKCVVATNIAETSVTIDGIVFVVDCGFSKQKIYHPQKAVEALGIRAISKASVKQRVGRAGRTRPGFAYHLYTFQGYCELSNETQAEILRSSLINETLSMLALGIENPLKFDYIDPPDEMTLARALETLYHLEAIDDNGRITKCGHDMARFPVDPRLAKAILCAHTRDLKCVYEILSIAAMLENKDKLFHRPQKSRNNNGGNGGDSEFKKRKRYFACVDGDHLTLLNVYNAYMQKKEKLESENSYTRDQKLRQFCRNNFWDFRSLTRAEKIRKQLEKVLYDIVSESAELNNSGSKVVQFKACKHTHRNYYDNILKALLCGYFLNVGVQGFNGKYWIFRVVELNEKHKGINVLDKAVPHPTSVFHKGPKRNWIIYDEVVISQLTYLNCCSAIKPAWLIEMANKYYDVRALAKDKSPIASVLRNVSES